MKRMAPRQLAIIYALWMMAAAVFGASAATPPALDGVFYETTNGRTMLPANLAVDAEKNGAAEATLPDGRVVKMTVSPEGKNFEVSLGAKPDGDISKWGLAVAAGPDEYFTGVMERVVDGPQ